MMEKITRQEASPATAPTRRSTLNQRLRHQALALAVTMALGLPQVQAQAVPDGSTSTSTQTAANGVPVINIAAPNKAGLSHNTYAQFDVGKQGLILNNSGSLSATQLAGYVTGNPNLSAGQSATLILNEVTSTRASQLAGAMEVAGTPAEVVVANPNGISCTGCGFINTPHAVLTTGRPVFGQDGGLSGFRVTGGTLSVAGDGLDGSLVDQVDLIARAVSINAGVWAKHLNVITGANQVDAASLAAQPIAGTGSTPVVALDVSALGGMYAGVIRLIGTEAGLGVNSQGQIAAQNGSLSLSSAGDVVLGGKTVATGDLSLQSSGAIEQSGTLASGGALSLIAAGSLGNHGLIQAQGGTITLQAGGALSNAADGSVQGNGALQLRAASLDNAGKIYALGGEWKATLGGAAVNHTSGDIYASQGITLSAASLGNDGAIEATTDTALTVSGALANTGHVQADQGDVTLRAGSLDNRGAVSAQHALGMQVSALAQNSGTLVAGGTVGITASQFSNTATGQLQSGTDLTVSAATLDNAGNLYAKGNAVLNGESLSNAAAAQLIADGSLVVNDTGDIVNAGLLQAGTDLRLQHAASLSNATDATIYAGGSLTLGLAQALDNHGLMYGAQAFSLTVGSADNEGTLRSGGDLSLDSAGELQNTGAIQAQQNLHLGGNAFTNAGKLYAIDGGLDGHVAGAFASTSAGDIYSGGHIALTLGSFSHAGVLEAGAGATITAQDTSDNTGTIQVDQGDLSATAAQLSNEGAFGAAGDLSLTGSSRLDNRGQLVAGHALALASASASNSGQTQSGAGTTLAIASFANSGRVQAGTDLTIRGNHDLTNTSTGQLLAAGDLGADTSALLDNAGVLQAGGKLAVLGAGAIRNRSTGMLYGTALTTLHLGGALDNAGTVYGAQGLDLAVLGLDNDGSLRSDAALDVSVQGEAHSTGTAYAAGQAQWNVTGALVDTGTLAGGGDVDISAASLDGDGTLAAGLSGDGTLGTTGNLHVVTTAGLSVHGRALAGGDLVLDGSTIDLSGSQVRAGSDATLTASQGDVSNQGGDLAANGRLTLTATGALLNGGDTVARGGHLTAHTLALQAASLDNRYGSLLQSGSDDLSLSFAGAFANAHGTLAANAGNLSISAASLDNAGGAIQHAGTGLLSLSTTGTLANAGGSIAGNGAATIHAGGTLDDTGGTLGLAGDLQLDADALDNSGGSLVADHVTLTIGHALTNTGGTLQSAHAMTVHAGTLANTGGFLKVTGTGEALTLVASGALANAASSGAGGFIGGNGDVSIQAASLANTAQIYAGRALGVVTTQGALVNDGGALQAMSSMQLDSAGALSNRSGTIEAGAGDAAATLALRTGSLDNTGGRIADSGTGTTTLGVGGNLVNQGGTLGGQGAVTLTAASLSNTQGAHLVAGDELGLTLGGMDNSAGTIYAAGDIDWRNSGASLLNTSGNLGAGGTLALVLGSVGNSAGALAASGDVTLQFSSLSGNGRVVAGRDLSLTLPGGFTNGVGNTLKANRDLSLQLGGDFANASGALLSAVRNLSVTAANIDNAAGAHIEASGTSLTASGNLTNEGRIEGDDITLKAGTFTNTDTVIGGAIDITASTLTNGIDLGTATDNAAYQTALIAATDGIDLWVSGTLLNRDATIFTLGDLRISADSSGTRSQAVINRSGDIEADGSVRIDAQQFTNQRRVFQTGSYTLSASEQAQNTYTGGQVAMYRYDDPDPLHHPPYVDASQVLDAQQIAALEAFCGTQGTPGQDGDQWCNGITMPGQTDPHNILHNDLRSITTNVLTVVQRLAAASAESRLLGGGDITLNGSVLNDKSTISAGNNLVINGQNGSGGGGSTGNETVQNIAWTPTGTVQQTIVEQTGIEHVSFDGHRHWDLAGYDPWGYYYPTVQLALGAGQPGWINYDAGPGLAATMSAGHTVSITAHNIDNTVVGADGQPVQVVIGLGQNAGAQSVNGGGSGTVGSVQGGHGGFTTVGLGDAPTSAAGGSLDQAPPRSGTSGGSVQPASPQVVSALGGAHPTVPLPQSGLYTVHTSPSSPYLVETDPRFTDYGQFISSDYMTDKLGIDPAAIGKRLGDGFYEQRTVLDQIASLTGRRFLSDDTDALSQYRSLMDAGVQTAQQFDLSVGVALTPEQMANLTQDMVWLVSATVDGQQVMVPVVYLSAEHARTLAAGGATIAGSTVVLNASGDITNNGAIKASQDAQLKAANLLNSGTLSAGGSLSISAAQDILNGGTINAGGNVSLVAGNDVRSGLAVATALGAVNLSDLGAPVSSVALGNLNQPGSIHAGGNLAISAGRDLSLDAAPVAAGGNLALAAGRDLTATATAISAGGDAQLLAGRDLSLLATGHTVRQGTLSNGVETTTHTVSTIDAGGSLLVAAGRDLGSQATSLTAGNQLGVSAGRDLNLSAVTDTQTQTSYALQGRTQITTTQRDESVRGATLSGANGVMVSAGHDLSATAATIASTQGNVVLAAGNDLTLSAAQEIHSTSTDTYTKKHGFLSSQTTTTHDASSDTYAIGTTVSGDNVVLSAGHDLTTQAAQLTADNALSVSAGHDVDFQAGEQSHSEEHDSSVKKSSFINTSARRFGSVDPESYSHQESHSSEQTWSIGSTLSGDTVTVGAGHDLSGTAVQIAGTHDVTLAAGHDLLLTAGQDTYTQTDGSDTSRTGLMNGGGFSVLIGNRTTKTDNSVSDVSYTGSLVGSTDGAVTLSAGNDVHITGSDVLSQTGTAIVGKNVTIDAAVGSTDTDQKQTLHTGGIHVGISGGAVSAAQGVYGAAQGVSHSSDNRLKALYAMQAAQDLYSPGAARGMGLAGGTGMDAISDAASDPHLASGKGGNNGGSGINLQIGITASTARSEAKTHDDTTYGSHIKSGGDITIAATGGDLNVVGSQVQGRNVSLSAAHDLNLLSQAEQHTDTQTSSNASGGIGVSIGSSGFGVYVEASMGKGKAHGNGTTHTDTSVTAADTLSLTAGNDMTIQGAQATGNTVLAGVGHNLNIASEQDTNDYASKQWQAGGQVMIGAGGGGSFNYSQSKAKSNYASVTQIGGFAAGDGGFQIYVGGNTDLKGAVIASTADPSKNLLDTGTLSYSDIQNQASYSASSMSAGSGGGLMGAGLGLSGLATPQHDNSSSTTQAGVAQGTILVRNNPGQDLDGLDRNPDINAGGLKPIFDADKVAEQQELSRVAGQVLFTGANDLVSSRRDQAEQDLQNAKIAYEHATTDEERATAKQQFQDAQGRLSAWGDGGTGKTAVQVLAGALQAQVGGGNVGSAAAGVAGNEFVLSRVSAALNNNGVPVDSAAHGTAMSLTSAGLGWLAGNVVGGDGDSGAVGAATAQYYGYYDYRDGRRQVAQWQSGLSAGAADGNAHVQQAMAAAIDKAIQMGADPADVVAGLSVPGVANDMRGVVQADAVALGMYGQSYDALDTAQQQAVLQHMAVVVVGAQQDAGAAGSANPLILVVSPQASNTAAYGSVGGTDGDLRAQVGGAASALIVSGETGVEKVVNWMGPSTAEGLGYVVMAATGGPMKTAGQILLDQSGATQWIQDQKDTYLINPLAGLVGQYGFDAQTQAQQQAVYSASHATASAGVNTLLSVVGGQTPNKGVKSIVGESEGFAEKVGQADQAIANDAETLAKGYSQSGEGAITGPNGGVYTPAGVDTSGNTVYESNGKYYTFEGGEKLPSTNPEPNGARQAEIDVGKDLPSDAKSQPAFKDGEQVSPNTPGCVKPDFCSGDMASWSVEVKRYNLSRPGGQADLINIVSDQAIARAKNLPSGMEQQVVIDIRGQGVTLEQQIAIRQGIVKRSNGAIGPNSIRFKTQ